MMSSHISNLKYQVAYGMVPDRCSRKCTSESKTSASSVGGEGSSEVLMEDEKKSWRSLFSNTLANHDSPLNFIPPE